MLKPDPTWRVRRVAAPGLMLVAAAACLAQPPHAYLAAYRAQVAFIGEQDASVTVALEVVPHDALGQVLIPRFADQELGAIEAGSSASPAFATAELPGALAIRFAKDAQPPAPLELHYGVHSRLRLRRVPLPVVGVAPQPQQHPVQISVELPPGTTVVGEGFPALAWRNGRHGEAQFAAAPSVLVVESELARSARWFDGWLTPAGLSTAAMFGLLLTGSAVWWAGARSRRPR